MMYVVRCEMYESSKCQVLTYIVQLTSYIAKSKLYKLKADVHRTPNI